MIFLQTNVAQDTNSQAKCKYSYQPPLCNATFHKVFLTKYEVTQTYNDLDMLRCVYHLF